MNIDERNPFIRWVYLPIVKSIGKINWDQPRIWLTGRRFNLTDHDRDYIQKLLSDDYYVILTFRKSHLSSYAVRIASFFKGFFSGQLRRPVWGHVLCNLEGDVVSRDDFRLIEATGKGVTLSKFDDVFDCDWVALMKIEGYSREEIRNAFDSLLIYDGDEYDNLFDLADDRKQSCGELIRDGLKRLGGYDSKFFDFEENIRKSKNLVPDDFYYSKNFETIFEIRR